MSNSVLNLEYVQGLQNRIAELKAKLDALEDRYWSHGLCPTCDATELTWYHHNGELVNVRCLVCNRERNG